MLASMTLELTKARRHGHMSATLQSRSTPVPVYRAADKFREGNSRTETVFFHSLCRNASYDLERVDCMSGVQSSSPHAFMGTHLAIATGGSQPCWPTLCKCAHRVGSLPARQVGRRAVRAPSRMPICCDEFSNSPGVTRGQASNYERNGRAATVKRLGRCAGRIDRLTVGCAHKAAVLPR